MPEANELLQQLAVLVALCDRAADDDTTLAPIDFHMALEPIPSDWLAQLGAQLSGAATALGHDDPDREAVTPTTRIGLTGSDGLTAPERKEFSECLAEAKERVRTITDRKPTAEQRRAAREWVGRSSDPMNGPHDQPTSQTPRPSTQSPPAEQGGGGHHTPTLAANTCDPRGTTAPLGSGSAGETESLTMMCVPRTATAPDARTVTRRASRTMPPTFRRPSAGRARPRMRPRGM